MNDQKLTAISVFMDGEADDDQINVTMSGLINDESMRATWVRYHLISDCINHRVPRYMDPSLANRVSTALKQEPTVLAPYSPVVRAVVKPLAGLAVAASVAALAIFSIQHVRAPQAVNSTPQVAAATAQAPAMPHPRQFTFTSGQAVARPGQPVSRLSPTLNRYLVNYNEYRSNAAVQGMFPYVRIVAHDDNQ